MPRRPRPSSAITAAPSHSHSCKELQAMIKRSLITILLAAGILLPAASAHAQSQPPQGPNNGVIGIRLLEAPVARKDDPRAHSYIVDHVSQGTLISRKIEVSNTTDALQAVNLYSGAAEVKDGKFEVEQDRGGDDVADWTAIAPGQVTVPSHGVVQATVTIAVPQNTDDGERYGVVWAEAAAPGAGGITVLNRVGIRVYLSVGVGAEPTSDFTIETLQAFHDEKTSQPSVQAMIRNTGGRALDMSGKLELHDGPGGLNAGPFTAELGTTLGIGQREPVTVKLDKQVPKGPWNAVITMQSGEIQHSAQARITFPDSGAAKPVKAESLAGKLKIFLPLLAIILALIVGLIIILKRRRRDKDNYAEVKADLKRFEELIKAQEGGATIPATTVDDPVVAIRAAIKQAKRAGDEKTAAKLESRLDTLLERQAAIPRPPLDDVLPSRKNNKVRPPAKFAEPREQEAAPPPPPTVSPPAPSLPAHAAAGPSPQPVPVAAAPAPTNGNGNGNTSLATILEALATAPPGGQRFALVKAARQYGREAIEAHADEVAALPEDVRIRLLRAAPQQPDPIEIA